jgi:hypothetical protein
VDLDTLLEIYLFFPLLALALALLPGSVFALWALAELLRLLSFFL